MKTKVFLVALFVLLVTINVMAQEDKSPRYLLQGSEMSFSGFGGPIVEFSSINGEFAVSVGGGGALLINQSFFFGGYGEGLTTTHYRYDLSKVVNIDSPKISFGHGGFWIGYIHNSYKAIHFGASAKLGWGQISLYDPYYTYAPEDYFAKDNVFIATPQVEIEMNLTPWLKLNLAGGYRVVTGIDKTYLNDQNERVNYYSASDFSSPVGTVSLLFGGFGK